MIKPIWAAVGGVALLGTAGGIGVLVTTIGGEEEAAVQDEHTVSAALTGTATLAASPTVAVTPFAEASAQPSREGVPADWPTYSDPGGLFTIRYPADWFQVENSVSSVDPSTADKSAYADSIHFEFSANRYDGYGCGVLAFDLASGQVAPQPGSTQSSLGGIPAWKIVREPGDPFLNDPYTRIEAVSTIQSGYCFNMAGYFKQQNPDGAIFSQVVSTFRFISAAEFTTYTHSASASAPAFNVAYPRNWFLTGGERPDGVSGMTIIMTPWDPATAPGRDGIPSNSMKVDMYVEKVDIAGEGSCSSNDSSESGEFGGRAGWTTTGLIDSDPSVTHRIVAANYAGFRFCISGLFADPPDPTIFDRLTESFRFGA